MYCIKLRVVLLQQNHHIAAIVASAAFTAITCLKVSSSVIGSSGSSLLHVSRLNCHPQPEPAGHTNRSTSNDHLIAKKHPDTEHYKDELQSCGAQNLAWTSAAAAVTAVLGVLFRYEVLQQHENKPVCDFHSTNDSNQAVQLFIAVTASCQLLPSPPLTMHDQGVDQY